VLAGVLIGAGVPAAWRLEFAAPLAFVAMTIPLLRDRAMVAAALAAALVIAFSSNMPLKLNILLAAATGIAVGLAMERKKWNSG